MTEFSSSADAPPFVAVVPARLASTRLPRKALREVAGKLLIGWVYEAVASSRLLDDVIIATDSDEIMEACQRHGWKAQMTSCSHRSGTERVHEISQSVTAAPVSSRTLSTSCQSLACLM